jgi:hypothetical protein
LSLLYFLKITLARITPHTGGQIREVFNHPDKAVKMGAEIDHVIFNPSLSSK